MNDNITKKEKQEKKKNWKDIKRVLKGEKLGKRIRSRWKK